MPTYLPFLAVLGLATAVCAQLPPTRQVAEQVAVDLGQRPTPPAVEAPPTSSPNSNPMANEDLYYRLDERGGLRTVNYAPQPTPRDSLIVSTSPTPWVAGHTGSALAAGTITPSATYNRVETGWAPGQLTETSLTWAAFLRVGNNHPAPSLSYVAGIPVANQFRVFTGATILVTSSWRASAPALRTVANVFGMASTNWVHVALVIDVNALTATYYIDGVAEAPVPIPGGFTANVTALNVGQQITTLAASIYEIDDFRIMTRAAAANEVLAWASGVEAADASYGAGCGLTLGSQNGPPLIGNTNYQLQLGATPNTAAAIMLGIARHDLGGVPLPLDLGVLFPPLVGCLWQTSAEISFPLFASTSVTTLALPIPPIVGLRNSPLYAQAYGLVLATQASQVSNPFAIGIGQ